MVDAGHVVARPELLAFEAALPRILPEHKGQYLVIQGDRLLRYFADYEEALEWAYSNLALDSFFLKRVDSIEMSTVHFTRDLGPCRNA